MEQMGSMVTKRAIHPNQTLPQGPSYTYHNRNRHLAHRRVYSLHIQTPPKNKVRSKVVSQKLICGDGGLPHRRNHKSLGVTSKHSLGIQAFGVRSNHTIGQACVFFASRALPPLCRSLLLRNPIQSSDWSFFVGAVVAVLLPLFEMFHVCLNSLMRAALPLMPCGLTGA